MITCTVWTSVSYFFKNIVGRCNNVTRIQLYGILSEQDNKDNDTISDSDTSADSSQRVYGHKPNDCKPDDSARGLVDVAFNSCGINIQEIHGIFANSNKTLRRLHIEFPTNLERDDLIEMVVRSGSHLQELILIGFEEQYKDDEESKPDDLVCQLLEACPSLRVFDYQEALASAHVFRNLQKSRLNAYSFTCVDTIRYVIYPSTLLERRDVFSQGGLVSRRTRDCKLVLTYTYVLCLSYDLILHSHPLIIPNPSFVVREKGQTTGWPISNSIVLHITLAVESSHPVSVSVSVFKFPAQPIKEDLSRLSVCLHTDDSLDQSGREQGATGSGRSRARLVVVKRYVTVFCTLPELNLSLPHIHANTQLRPQALD